MGLTAFTGELDAPSTLKPFAGDLDAEQPASLADKMAGSWGGRILQGVASPALAAAQVFGGEKGRAAVAELEAMKQRGMKAEGNEGFDAYGLLGSMLPGAGIAKGVSAVLPAAQSLGTRLLQGAGVGAATSAAQPVSDGEPSNFWMDKLKQIGIGTGAGAAAPLVGQTMMAGKAALEPFYDSGRNAIIGRTLNTAAGGQQGSAIRELLASRELVPGSWPTVGQASGNAGLASLERAASSIDPSVTVAFQGREAAQNAARTALLRGIAGTDADRQFAEMARKSATAPLIAAVTRSSAPVDTLRTDQLIDRIIAKSPGRSQLTNVLKNVKESLYDDAGNLRSNVSQLYQGARKNMTDLLAAKAGDGSKVNEAVSRELSLVMKSLDHQINKAEPAYGQFMGDFSAMSKPINRMDVGRKIEEKAVNPLTDVIRPDSYARALSDKIAQQATGFKRATLEGTMTPTQMDKLNAIKDDLTRAVIARNAAGVAGSDTVKKLAYSNLVDRAGIPTFLRELAPAQMVGNILARGADSVYGSANKEIANQLAMTLLDPKKAAQFMQGAAPSRYASIINTLMQQGAGAAGTAAGRNPGGY